MKFSAEQCHTPQFLTAIITTISFKKANVSFHIYKFKNQAYLMQAILN